MTREMKTIDEKRSDLFLLGRTLGKCASFLRDENLNIKKRQFISIFGCGKRFERD